MLPDLHLLQVRYHLPLFWSSSTKPPVHSLQRDSLRDKHRPAQHTLPLSLVHLVYPPELLTGTVRSFIDLLFRKTWSLNLSSDQGPWEDKPILGLKPLSRLKQRPYRHRGLLSRQAGHCRAGECLVSWQSWSWSIASGIGCLAFLDLRKQCLDIHCRACTKGSDHFCYAYSRHLLFWNPRLCSRLLSAQA